MPLDKSKFAASLLATQRSMSYSAPIRVHAERLVRKLLATFFPQLGETLVKSEEEYVGLLDDIEVQLHRALQAVLGNRPPAEVITPFMDSLPRIFDELKLDVEAIDRGDPAATGADEVVHAYPGLMAIAIYRAAHEIHKAKVPLLPRVLTEYAHEKTGIDIHPGAKIEPEFCIDHGTGIVIGATSVIGRNVRIYQGVTLGGLVVKKELAKDKRHPTIEENVVIYANATILGGDTVIGKNSIIGGNVWLTSSVPPNSIIYHEDHLGLKRAERGGL